VYTRNNRAMNRHQWASVDNTETID